MTEEPVPDEREPRVVSPSEVAEWDRVEWVKRTRAAFAVWGGVTGIAATIVAIVLSSSWELGVFALPMAVYVARGVAHVVTDRDKVRRAFFFGLGPLAGCGTVAAAYAAWGRWWAAVLLGAAAAVGGHLVAKALFRRVAHEERLERIRGV
jgi:hypothetical protein